MSLDTSILLFLVLLLFSSSILLLFVELFSMNVTKSPSLLSALLLLAIKLMKSPIIGTYLLKASLQSLIMQIPKEKFFISKNLIKYLSFSRI